MKRLLLLFALECYALTLPSFDNPAIWNVAEARRVEKTKAIVFRYSEPFENFHNGKTDIVWSDGRFLVAAGFGGAVLDSIYRELEFSGDIGFKPFEFLSFSIGETANISWVPGDGSWQEHSILAGASFLYRDWGKVYLLQKTHLVSKTPVDFSGILGFEANFSDFYSFGVQWPLHIYQSVKLGYFSIYNSFAYPGPVLGFGFGLGVSRASVGVGYLRAGHPDGNLGYAAKFFIY
ncbi:MAG: hypothetical protein FWC26_00655 [Fibromonadales bacterium]|nr:hypothetical protein [Fibromonadales bacterium]